MYQRETQLRYYYKNREAILEKKKKRDRKRMYGISDEEYKQLLEETQGKCEICGIIPDPIAIDHDHDTGKIRGLLCRPCNSGLGFFKDSVLILDKARGYLEKDRN